MCNYQVALVFFYCFTELFCRIYAVFDSLPLTLNGLYRIIMTPFVYLPVHFRRFLGGTEMNAVGIIRRLDELGRVVIPVELRRALDLNTKDSVEIIADGDSLILRKYQPNCLLCGSNTGLAEFRGRRICRRCLDELAGIK